MNLEFNRESPEDPLTVTADFDYAQSDEVTLAFMLDVISKANRIMNYVRAKVDLDAS